MATQSSRSFQDAINACERRRLAAQVTRTLPLAQTPLEQVLRTSRSNSRHIGLVNDYLWDEDEELDWGGPIILPVSPLLEDESGEPLWFANSRFPTRFRNDAPGFSESKQRVADRTLWALHRGSEALALAIIEIDEDRSLENLPPLLEHLARVGVRTYVLGNEIDDPFARSFRYKPDRLVQAFDIANEVLERTRRGTANLCLPASPYLDDDGSDVLRIAGLLAGKPFNSASHHYFGSVGSFLPWVEKRQAALAGMGLRHYLTELGGTPGQISIGKFLGLGILPKDTSHRSCPSL